MFLPLRSHHSIKCWRSCHHWHHTSTLESYISHRYCYPTLFKMIVVAAQVHTVELFYTSCASFNAQQPDMLGEKNTWILMMVMAGFPVWITCFRLASDTDYTFMHACSLWQSLMDTQEQHHDFLSPHYTHVHAQKLTRKCLKCKLNGQNIHSCGLPMPNMWIHVRRSFRAQLQKTWLFLFGW